MNFESIAPYLKDPMVLVGFFFFLAFLFLRSLVKRGIIPVLGRTQGFQILKLILLYGFVFGIVLMGLGFGLKYRQLNEAEQLRLVRQLDVELGNNLDTINELALNTETFLKRIKETSEILRTPGIDILVVLFPKQNLDLEASINTIEEANLAWDELVRRQLHLNELQMNRFNAAGKMIARTISTIRPSLSNLADQEKKRYVISKDIWQSNLPVYRKVDIIDVTKFQEAYNKLDHLRNQYTVISVHCLEYLFSVEEFFQPANNKMTKENLSEILSKERLTYQVVTDFSDLLVETIESLQTIKSEIIIVGS